MNRTADATAARSCLVWVIDDDAVLVEFLLGLIAELGVEVLGYTDPLAFLQRCDEGLPEQPQVLLCDLQMPGIDGIELARMLHLRGYFQPVVLMSAFLDVERTIEAMREGFFDVVTKPIDPAALLTEVGKAVASAQDSYAARHTAARMQQRMEQLTVREQDVVRGLSQGLMNKQVAELLNLSVKTIETHRQHIMEKLGLRNAAELTRFAIEWRMLQRRAH